jgi:hypothetical protein
MKKRIVIPYFPIELKYSSVLLAVAAVYLIINGNLIWSSILILLASVFLTTEYVTELNLKENSIEDYLSVLWIPFDKDIVKYNTMERIIIQKGNYAQTINTRAQSRQMDWSDFTGTLVYDNNRVLDLLTKNKKSELLKGIKEVAIFLNVEVEDCTTNHPYIVDLSKIEA